MDSIRDYFMKRRGTRALVVTQGAFPYSELLVDRFEDLIILGDPLERSSFAKNVRFLQESDLQERPLGFDFSMIVGTSNQELFSKQLELCARYLRAGGRLAVLRRLAIATNKRQENYLRYRKLMHNNGLSALINSETILEYFSNANLRHARILQTTSEHTPIDFAEQCISKLAALTKRPDASCEEIEQVIEGIRTVGIERTGLELLSAQRDGALSAAGTQHETGANPHWKSLEEIQQYLRKQHREHVVAAFFDSSNQYLDAEVISIGSANAAEIDFASVLRPAIIRGAAEILLLHNHPSGNMRPSTEDILLTRELHTAAKLLGISLRDHLIIGAQGSASALS